MPRISEPAPEYTIRASKPELLDIVLSAIAASGWQSLVMKGHHPFSLRVFREDGQKIDLRIYIWNCTPGGKNRSEDEFRIQFTTKPTKSGHEITLLLGWHAGYGVFVGWDIKRHDGQQTKSPSTQVSREALLAAHRHTFAVHDRSDGEVVVVFQPQQFVEYALHASDLHGKVGQRTDSKSVLNELDRASTRDIEKIGDVSRRTIVATIKRQYRRYDFSNRVLTAYGQRCAMCGVQLNLIEAAHILPVAVDSSTDETSNGVALCALHHTAFDHNFVSFNEDYAVEISPSSLQRLTDENLIGGLSDFRNLLLPALLLPADIRDYPNPKYVSEARRLRGW